MGREALILILRSLTSRLVYRMWQFNTARPGPQCSWQDWNKTRRKQKHDQAAIELYASLNIPVRYVLIMYNPPPPYCGVRAKQLCTWSGPERKVPRSGVS